MKAIIIGAGIGGVTAGIALQQAGLEVAIYEREAELRPVGAGLTLWANAIHGMDKLGVGEALRQYSVMGGEGGIHSRSGRNIMVTDIRELERRVGLPNVVIHRAELQRILLESFGGIIHYAKAVQEYHQQGEKVCVRFQDGSTAEADLLIGCDGIHSVIRQQMLPDSKPKYAGYTAYRGVLEFDHARVKDMWGETWGCGHRFGFAPLRDNRIYWFATANVPEHQVTPAGNRQETLSAIFKDWHEPIPQLIEETPEEHILQHSIAAIEPLKSWQDGRVILLGDAAHAMTPNLGQGACQAIEDAVVLGELFQTTSDVQAVLSRYQQMRLPRANGVLKQSQTIGRVGQIENPILCRLRDTAMRVLPQSIRMKPVLDVISHRV